MKQPARTKNRRRPAFVMIAVLVLLVVTTALATNWTTNVLRERRQVKLHLMHRQAVRLAESAVGRAVARLKSDPNYVGELWRLTEDDLGATYAAEVQIRIEAKTDGHPKRIVAQATLPPGIDSPIRHSMTFIIPNPGLSPLSSGNPSP